MSVPCVVVEKFEETSTSSPSGSPRPSQKPVDQVEDPSPKVKEYSGYPPQEFPLGLEGRSSNTDLNPSELVKTESLTTSTKEKKTKKKSSWFNSFYPTYKSRSEDFKRIFKEVPDEERLVVDYSCAVQKEILVHGRLYVTQNYLCFYANIFGWETNIALRWKDVAAITKEKTALVIPNAILISTKSEKYFFASFVARDKVYMMLFRVWQNALMDRQMSSQEMWQWVHQSYGAELGLTSDDEDYIAPGTEEGKLSNREADNNTTDSANSSKIKMKDDKENGFNDLNGTNSTKTSTDARGSDRSDSDFSELDLPSKCDIENVNCTSLHEGRVLINELIPIHVDQLFTILFTTSKFYLDFHTSRRTTDIIQTPWTPNSVDNSQTRVVNLTVALSQPIGPKSSHVTETQTMLPCSKPGVLYSIDTDSVSAGVPYADSFVIEQHYCIKKVSEHQSSMAVYAQVKFKKSVWGLVKGMIEKNCWSGMDEFYTSLVKALHAESDEYPAPDVKRKIKRKRKFYPCSKNETPVTAIGSSAQPKEVAPSILSPEKTSLFFLVVLVLFFALNVFLYLKLRALEKDQPIDNVLNLELLKNPPASHEEWVKLLQKQDRLHTEEVVKWNELLKAAVESLQKAEDLLVSVQQSASSRILSKVTVDDIETEGPRTDKTPSVEL